MIKSVPSRKCCLEEKLEHYLQFTPKLNELEQVFLLLQSITLDDFPKDLLEKVAIRTDAMAIM